MKTKILFLVVLLVFLAGCTTAPSDEERTDPTDQYTQGITVHYFEDKDVVCFVYRDDANNLSVGGTGGISCLPADEVEGYGS